MKSAHLVLGLVLLGARPALAQRNVLVIVADDLGPDRVGAYAENPDPGRTPNIDRLAANGVLFRTVWASPFCSPARACFLTGQHSFRTGIGVRIAWNQPDYGLQPGFAPIAERLRPLYSSAAIGKWHLADNSQPTDHPLRVGGFEHHHGSLFNLGGFQGGYQSSYFYWQKFIDGQPEISEVYATTDSADEAIAAIRRLPEPWFVWLAFNAPHLPAHVPPAHLHTYPPPLAGVPNQYRAMVEAMDTEMGRVLAEIGPEDTVIFTSDNGPYEQAITAPQDPTHGKGTIFEGGLRVPLIVVGPDVERPGSECAALVSATDLLATIADITGLPMSAPDSISFHPYLSNPDRPSIRRTLYSEHFGPNGPPPFEHWRRAIRDERYKLHRGSNADQFYDLELDPYEQSDLLEVGLDEAQRERYQYLDRQMVLLVGR